MFYGMVYFIQKIVLIGYNFFFYRFEGCGVYDFFELVLFLLQLFYRGYLQVLYVWIYGYKDVSGFIVCGYFDMVYIVCFFFEIYVKDFMS